MKKGIRILLWVMISILLVAVVLGVVFLNYNANATISSPTEKTHLSWMGNLSDDVLLKEVVIPGSHDAATKDMLWMGETQSLSIKGQLECGARYLDIRLQQKKDLVVFHGPLTGMKGQYVFDDIAEFMETNETEVLLLDFQHFKDGSEKAIIEILEERLGKYLVHNDGEKNDVDFIDSLTLGEVRGKCIVFWGANDEYIAKDYVFLRNDDAGDREGSTLQSYYNEDYNSMSSDKYIESGLNFYLQTRKENGKGLFVLQGQLTDSWRIRGPKFLEAGHSRNMSEYITALKDSEDLQYINIIMRDYVNHIKMEEIIALNYYKGNVKSEEEETFLGEFHI